MTAPLEGAALFDRVERIVGGVHTLPMGWSLVPAMLEWLKLRGTVDVRFYVGRNGPVSFGLVHRQDGGLDVDDMEEEPDLPTALARLVVKVAELEGEA